MFLRIETGIKAGLSDPYADKILADIRAMHPALAQNIRWLRLLKVNWLNFEGSREKLVHAMQVAYKNPVVDWIFTGDLLPSAAGATGTLLDIMHDSPNRPGVFYGIEKRKRLKSHDEDANLILEMIQTCLQRKLPDDKVVSGEMLLIEGSRLVQSDLEWVARHVFTKESEESWSWLSEEELKSNARFQGDQVAKYFLSPELGHNSKLLKFRANQLTSNSEHNFEKAKERFLSPEHISQTKSPRVVTEEWSVIPDLRFSGSKLGPEKHQLEHLVRDSETKLQTILTVLPDQNILWKSEDSKPHPYRIQKDFESELTKISQSTDTAIALMKCLLETDEKEPWYYWTGSVSVDFEDHYIFPSDNQNKVIDLYFVGYQDVFDKNDLIFLQKLKSFYKIALKAKSVSVAVPTLNRDLVQIFHSLSEVISQGIDIETQGIQDWFFKSINSTMPLGLIWGVPAENQDWFKSELRIRNIPFLQVGTTSDSKEIRIYESGKMKFSLQTEDFFSSFNREDDKVKKLLPEILYTQEKKSQPAHFKNRYSVERLVLKPEYHHVGVASPVVMRPSLKHWSGIMILSDLVSLEFNEKYVDYLLRRSTAMGGQIESIQTSFVNGLRSWWDVLARYEREFGLTISSTEMLENPEIRAHWCAIQVVSKVADIRSVRTEDFKMASDRIYWLPGSFEYPATRWLSSFEGRNQTALHSAIAIKSEGEDLTGVISTLVFALSKRKLGAEVRLQHFFAGGFFVSLSENERFAIEEEWRLLGIEFEFVGRVTSSPYLIIRNDHHETQTISIEDVI